MVRNGGGVVDIGDIGRIKQGFCLWGLRGKRKEDKDCLGMQKV